MERLRLARPAVAAADRYWAQFIRSLPSASDGLRAYYEAFHFGFGTTREDGREIATQIAGLVVAGTKTSTTSVKWVYEVGGKRVATPGDLSIVLDGHDDPVCIIETTEVNIVPYDEMMDEQFAYEGGEDD